MKETFKFRGWTRPGFLLGELGTFVALFELPTFPWGTFIKLKKLLEMLEFLIKLGLYN